VNDLEITKLNELESIHWWYLVRKRILTSWCKVLPMDAKILDLGSGTGGNSVLMQDLGFEVTGLEYSRLGVSIQMQKGINVIWGDARNLPFADSEFDAVICLDCLEHIDDDARVMDEIFRVTKSSGHVLISVPEDPKLWSGHDIAVGHFRRYKQEGIEKLATESGFVVLKSNSQNWIFKPLVKFTRRSQSGSQLKELNVILNTLLYWISRFELLFRLFRFTGMTRWLHLKVSK
jgi:SAM-dependent methyltransferase